MQYFFVCILGCVMGSFINMCVYRIPRRESIIYPPSHCEKCGHILAVVDKIPIISYILSSGKCRYCKEKINIQYPIVEVLCAVMFLAVFKEYGLSLEFLKYGFFITISMIIAVIDYNTEDVYEEVTVCGIIAASLFIILENLFNKEEVADYFWGLIMALLFFGVICMITRCVSMGKGDMQYAAVCGLFIGKDKLIIELILALFIASIMAAVLIKLKRKTWKSHIAFTPYLMIGAVLSIIFGSEILRLYLLYGI